jgi:hypothetical protein
MRAPIPTTWDDASLQALEYITNIVSTVRFEEPVWKKYNAILDSLANFVTWSEAASEAQAVSVMVDAGCMAMHSLVPLTLGMDKTEMHRLLCRKQHDYGHGNISKFGLIGVAVRMCDKIARAENMTKKGGASAQVTEPFERCLRGHYRLCRDCGDVVSEYFYVAFGFV